MVRACCNVPLMANLFAKSIDLFYFDWRNCFFAKTRVCYLNKVLKHRLLALFESSQDNWYANCITSVQSKLRCFFSKKPKTLFSLQTDRRMYSRVLKMIKGYLGYTRPKKNQLMKGGFRASSEFFLHTEFFLFSTGAIE